MNTCRSREVEERRLLRGCGVSGCQSDNVVLGAVEREVGIVEVLHEWGSRWECGFTLHL